jgi:hypothetical protein
MREQPVQSYYPRARLRLIVRLEEFGSVATTPTPPKQPPHFRKGKGVDPKAKAPKAQKDPKSGAWYIGAPSSAGSSGSTPQGQTTSSDDRTFKIEGIIPTKMTIMRNGTRVADTLSATFRYLDFPLDPRAVRSMAIEAFLGTVSEEDYARQMTGAVSSSANGYLPERYVDTYGRPRSNLRFQGFADEISVEFDEEGEPMISIECTDNTALLLDQDAPPKLTVSPTEPIDQAVADYLANFPQFRGLSVLYEPQGATPPSLKKALAKTAFKPTLGPPPAGGAGGAGGAGATKFAVWDYLTDVAGALGLLIRMVGTTIVLQRPRTLYAAKFSGRSDDPFTGRILPSGRNVTNRLFIYGRNMQKQSFKRRLRRPATHSNIEVRCYSGRQGKTIAVRFPGTAKGDRQKSLTPGNAADEKWKVITVSGIEDEATLRAIAQAAYEQVGRNELAVRFQTINLGSYGGSNSDPDVLDLEAGDPIDLEVARTSPGQVTAGNAVNTVEEQLATRANGFLRDLGYDADFARAYGKCIATSGLSSSYRVKTVSFDWSDDYDAGSGGGGDEQALVIDIEAVNFIEVRQSKDLPAGEEIEPPAPKAGGPVRVTVQDDASGSSGSPWI